MADEAFSWPSEIGAPMGLQTGASASAGSGSVYDNSTAPAPAASQPRTPQLLIVTEFCPKGNLVDYLRSRGRSVITQADQIKFALYAFCFFLFFSF